MRRPLTNHSAGHLNSYTTSSNCVSGKVTLVVVAYRWTRDFVFGVMREEANPRKLQRRALDYGALPSPISSSSLRLTAVAGPFASRSLAPLMSSNPVAQPAKSIASETKSKTLVTHSKQTPATKINRYFLTSFSRLASRLLPLARHRRSARFFPATAARAC
jgi:hypothetical protein